MRACARLVVIVGVIGLARLAMAADQPLAGTKLLLQRSGSQQRLVLIMRDPSLLFPTIGSADDPGTGVPGGATIELFSVGEGNAVLAIPPGAGSPGWRAHAGSHDQHTFSNKNAPAAPSAVRTTVIREGKILQVVAKATGLPLATAQGAVGVRVTTGSLRNCALFDAASVVQDKPGRFLAKNALVAGLTDCSDASLGAPSPCESSAPTCGGSCPGGDECMVTLGGYQCVCLPPGSPACGTPGAPTCGGLCPSGQDCNPAFLPIQSGGGLSCGCGIQDCGNGAAYGVDDFGNPGCFLTLCAGTYPTCGGACGDGGECSALHFSAPGFSVEYCICALPASCCAGGYECSSGDVCTVTGGVGCSCTAP